MSRKSFFILSVVSLLLLSCDGMDTPSAGQGVTPPAEEEKESVLILDADTFYIKSDGISSSTFTVYLDGEVLSGGYTISKVENGQTVAYNSDSWSSGLEGEATFVASYQLSESAESDGVQPVVLTSPKITIKAVPYDVPSTVADPKPACLDFVRRMFLVQFTGTGCSACPGMRAALEKFLNQDGYASKSVLAAVHPKGLSLYTENDPARIDIPLHVPFGLNALPALSMNLELCTYTAWSEEFYSVLKSRFNRQYRTPAKVGISVNSVREGEELMVKITVKAAETSPLRVGAWILEDGIIGPQAGTDNPAYTIHNNCVRGVQGVVEEGEDYSGTFMGAVEKGARAEHVFRFTIDEGWDFDKCRLVAFVTIPDAQGRKYYVNNVIACPITGQMPFEYNE